MRCQITDEDAIVWVEDPERFDYVREWRIPTAQRRNPITAKRLGLDGRVVGYTTLRRDAPNAGQNGLFYRRIFWVKPYDRSENPDDVYKTGTPAEGVDPRTLAPGVEGQLTDRAWNGRRDHAHNEMHRESAEAIRRRQWNWEQPPLPWD